MQETKEIENQPKLNNLTKFNFDQWHNQPQNSGTPVHLLMKEVASEMVRWVACPVEIPIQQVYWLRHLHYQQQSYCY